MKLLFLPFCILLIILSSSCNKAKDDANERIVFDQGDLQVISFSVNKKMETMSILYGNNDACKASLNALNNHSSGERFIFVTWKYHENPYWYGSKINGELLSVENIQVIDLGHLKNFIQYKLKAGKVQLVNGKILDEQDRLNYILNYRPAEEP